MNETLNEFKTKIKEIIDILESFETKEEAIDFLMKETNLSKKECTDAYDIYMKISKKLK